MSYQVLCTCHFKAIVLHLSSCSVYLYRHEYNKQLLMSLIKLDIIEEWMGVQKFHFVHNFRGNKWHMI